MLPATLLPSDVFLKGQNLIQLLRLQDYLQ